ncbi:toll-like receptor 3 [Strongylocentrotus purpuratus]|uniref:TIR domain-containing protein n=1 Tax=Strongylocentrotus purpuratus TaxID=7668 RepID=A0A7M7T2K8_STRPU|nr:toll-like receptor 3 [Strongylocentrotus purpuratus]
MSLLSARSLVKDVSGSLSPKSTNGCQLRNTSLGLKANCTHLDLKSVPQDLPSNTVILRLTSNKITTLFNSSFAYLPDIVILGLASNILSKIESGAFKPLAHLRELSLSNNRLVSLPSGLLCMNNFLSTLILCTNRLFSFPGDALPWSNSIKKLDVSGNKISLIDSRDLKPLQNCSLERLSLVNNALSSLPLNIFSYLSTVRVLGISRNNFRKFHISMVLGSTVITNLFFESCKIHEIIPLNKSHVSLGEWGNISKLSLASNIIIYVPDFAFWGFNQTTVISLHNSQIAKLSNRSFCGLDHLIQLDLSYNRLTTISLDMFSCNKMLQQLKLNGNNIARLSIGKESGLSLLYILDLAHNNIKDIEISRKNVTFPSVEYIDLSFNRFTWIKRLILWSFTNLKILNLSNNDIYYSYSPNSFINLRLLQELYLTNEHLQIINKAFRYLGALTVLDLSFAPLKLTSISQFTNTSSLTTLIMRENSLRSTDMYHVKTKSSLFLGLDSLERLDLRQNKLDMLVPGTFKPLKKLKILDLSQSSITVLSRGVFDSLTALMTLDLRDNEITKISECLLQTQYHLAVLFLSNNKLETIPRTLFNETSSLHSLYIQENKITTIEPNTMFPTNTTLKLDAYGNPFSCTCRLSWFVNWLHSGNVELRNREITFCSLTSIKEEVHSPILSFNPDQFCGIDTVMITCVSFSVVLVVVICLVAYRKRWWLNYKLFLLKLAIFGYEEINQDFDAQDYEYQLNIMYNEDDEEWVDRIMKPMLQERFPHLRKVVFGDNDLNIGMFYINALHYATEISFKTVLLISYNSVDDAWFLTKLRIALEHINDTRLDKVILIFIEDIHDEDLPYLVRLFLSKNKPYMLWTDDEDGQELFWAQFEKSMRANRALNSVIPV